MTSRSLSNVNEQPWWVAVTDEVVKLSGPRIGRRSCEPSARWEETAGASRLSAIRRDKALVLCVDEKSQVQALERTQPVLPMGLGYVEGVTHDYYRHGTTTLFAALDTLDGKVITLCKPRHRHQEFLAFLNHLDHSVPAGLDIHLIADNYGTHKHPKVKAWLARRPRYHLHYTPTYSSWLNQVERWFGLITQQAIRRGSFRSVGELVQKIDEWMPQKEAGAIHR
jgi:transposase